MLDFPLICLDPGHPRIQAESNGSLNRMDPSAGFTETVRTVQALEDAGYSRYWLGEHHVAGNFHGCPEIMLGALASNTRRIRLGTAGVLLPYSRPYKVAEAFRALGTWFPGRIDAGLAKGPGADAQALAALSLHTSFSGLEFRAHMEEVNRLLQPCPASTICPPENPQLQVWCHSGNPETWRLAAKLGMGIGIALFFEKDKSRKALEAIGSQVEAAYLANFEPGPMNRSPSIASLDWLLCIEDRAALGRGRARYARNLPGLQVLSPEGGAEYARQAVELTQATEFGIYQSPFQPDIVRSSSRLFARELGGADRVTLPVAAPV